LLLAKLRAGAALSIFVVKDRPDAPSLVQTFLADTPEPARKKLAKAIARLAEYGAHPSVEKNRPIKGEPGLFELKEERTYRLMYFLVGRRSVVLTHGFRAHRGAPLAIDIARARSVREQVRKLWNPAFEDE
jgi:phage-related protein